MTTDEEYKKAVISISKQLPHLIQAIKEHSTKIERHIRLGK